MEKLAGDLLLGLKFVRLEFLSTSFIDFLYEGLGELSQVKIFGPERVNITLIPICIILSPHNPGLLLITVSFVTLLKE